jgi:hypothetical protein
MSRTIMPAISHSMYLPWPPWVTRHRYRIFLIFCHVAQGGQGKYCFVSLSLTVSLTKFANVNDPLLRLFHPLNSLVVTRKLLLILLSKVKHTSKNLQNSMDSRYGLIFSSSFSICRVISNFVIFTKQKLQNIFGTNAANWQQKLVADTPSFSKSWTILKPLPELDILI